MAPLRTLGALTSTALLASSAVAFAPAPSDGLAAQVATVATAPDGRALAVAEPDGAPEGGVWTETYIDTADGERLHADIFRSAGKDDSVKEPVILVVSPYLGQESLTGTPKPSPRFFDFFEGADVLGEGYTVVQVSTRGTGGSSGCLDILGPGEQEDIRAAVDWAANQPWSTGKVGMYGKSYDANTGAAGAATLTAEDGLHAVVAQQIAVDRYRGSYNDRVRLIQSLLYPSVSYGSGGEAGFSSQSDTEYIANSVTRSGDCQALLAEHYVDEEHIDFWRVRDFPELADDSTVPTFITTGYLDTATNIGAGAIDLFETLEGPKRLWVGWWGHDRGNDTSGDGRLAMGREGFFDEVMAWYDEHLKGVKPKVDYPVVAAQDSTGVWREQDAWHTEDTDWADIELLSGSYQDDGRNVGSKDSAAGAGGLVTARSLTGHGTWTFTEPVAEAVHIAGTPTAHVEVGFPVAPRATVVVNVYDVDPQTMQATMITRGAGTIDDSGRKDVLLFPTDWVVAEGHVIGVLVSGANQEAYTHTPTNTTVPVAGGTVTLPYLTDDIEIIDGQPAPRLETYRFTAPFTLNVDISSRTNGAWAGEDD